MPARWTDAHHIHHWIDGGRTDLANMVLLCRRHHRILHGTEWEIHVVNDIPYFKPPKWVDLEQKLVRNVLRH
ncbi:MAG: HNH endonuclease signature motif containing protein [Labedaea sp.]